MLQDYQEKFLEFAIRNKVLLFGEFELKSGRTSPYFFNAGLFNSGVMLRELGEYYADALIASGMPFDILFGPAYKGIPLVTSTVIALAERYHRDVPYVFNRKEIKAHGEGGQLVGSPLAGRVVVVDDVITAGTAIREVMELIRGYEATVTGALVAIDRQEKGASDLSAIQELERDYGVSVVSVIKLDDIITYIEGKAEFQEELGQVRKYRDKYGVTT